jgi:hypothetical protein
MFLSTAHCLSQGWLVLETYRKDDAVDPVASKVTAAQRRSRTLCLGSHPLPPFFQTPPPASAASEARQDRADRLGASSGVTNPQPWTAISKPPYKLDGDCCTGADRVGTDQPLKTPAPHRRNGCERRRAQHIVLETHHTTNSTEKCQLS